MGIAECDCTNVFQYDHNYGIAGHSTKCGLSVHGSR